MTKKTPKKNQVLKSKGYLTLGRCADALADLLGEDVKRQDILQIALDGKIQLSVDFVVDTYAIPCRVISEKEALSIEAGIKDSYDGQAPKRTNYDIIGSVRLAHDQYLVPDPGDLVNVLTGYWELMPIGNGAQEIRKMIYGADDPSFDVEITGSGIYVRKGGLYYSLRTRAKSEYINPSTPEFSLGNYDWAQWLDGYAIVVQSNEVERFALEPNGRRLSTQARREIVLEKYLRKNNIERSEIYPLTYRLLWTKLTEQDGQLFPDLADETIVAFFKAANVHSRRGYRPPEE